MRSRGALALLVLGLLTGACAVGGAAGTPVAGMPTPLGGERVPPPGLFTSGRAMNGCGEASATPVGRGSVAIVFGGESGERYRPRCVSVTVGTRVAFHGDFAQHPMTGGVVMDGEAFRDASSPLPFTSAGTDAAFVPLAPGIYPFFCQVHWVLGMSGAVIAR